MTHLIVYDSMGKIVYKETVSRVFLENEKLLDLSFLPNGVYLVHFSADHLGQYSKLLLVK